MSIAENLAPLRARIDAAARASGRTGGDILLVGASKMNDAAACREAIAAGIDVLGENKVQEMQLKLTQEAYTGAPLHFIGHLQRNKVRQVVGVVALIQSVGSVELLEEIEKCAAKRDLVQDVLLEVNVGGEDSKSGFPPEELEAGARLARTLPHVRVLGLMTIPPVQTQENGTSPYFEKVQRLYVDINQKVYDNTLKYVSMGMSDDFEDAIRCGANMVRLGTAVFGRRDYA